MQEYYFYQLLGINKSKKNCSFASKQHQQTENQQKIEDVILLNFKNCTSERTHYHHEDSSPLQAKLGSKQKPAPPYSSSIKVLLALVGLSIQLTLSKSL